MERRFVDTMKMRIYQISKELALVCRHTSRTDGMYMTELESQHSHLFGGTHLQCSIKSCCHDFEDDLFDHTYEELDMFEEDSNEDYDNVANDDD